MSDQHPIHQTPPESFTCTPLTPPPTIEKTSLAVSIIVHDIKNCRDGHSPLPTSWTAYSLSTVDYEDLLKFLRRDNHLWEYITHKLHYDYFPYARRFILRMPTALHEALISNVAEDLRRQIASIGCGQTSSASFAQEIDPVGSSTIQFTEEEFGKHDPDAQFRHSHARYPGVIIEVSYSQKKRDLPYLADDYILGSDADIRVVIGLDIDYKGSKKATLSVWRPEIVTNDIGENELTVRQTVTDQVFRDERGSPTKSPEAGINLQLQDFATEELTKPYGVLADPISISANTLCTYLQHAEKKAAGYVVRSAKPWTRKRRRLHTPPEELCATREKKFRHDEERMTEQADRKDSSYEPSSE